MKRLLLIETVSYATALLVMATGLLGASQTLFGAGLAIAAAAGIYKLWAVLSNARQNFSIAAMLGSTTAVSYFLGGAISLFAASATELRFWNIANEFDLRQIFAAAVYVALFVTMLSAVGAVECRYWRGFLAKLAPSEAWPATVTLGLLLLAGLQVGLLVTGLWSFRGFELGENDTQPMAIALVVALCWPIAGVSGWVIGRGRFWDNPALFATCLGVLPIELIWGLAYGRRVVAYQIFVFVVMFLWSRRRRVGLRSWIVVGLLALPVMYYLSHLFLAMRLDANRESRFLPQQRLTLFERIEDGSKLLSTRSELVSRRHNENLATRFFVIGYLSSLIHHTEPGSALLGQDLAIQVLAAVPRALFPPKTEIIASTGKLEWLVNPRFGLRARDEANSLVTSSYADFLWLGFVVMPILVGGLGLAYVWVARAMTSEPFRVYFMSYVLYTFLNVEESFTFYLLTLRTMLLIAVLAALVRLIRHVMGGESSLVRQRALRRVSR